MTNDNGSEGARPDAPEDGAGPQKPSAPHRESDEPVMEPKEQPGSGSLFAAAREKLGLSSSEAELERVKNEAANLVGKLNEELANEKDAKLRLAAEMENLRRRTEREKLDAAKYANTRFGRDLLAVADTFERAMATIDKSQFDEASPVGKFLEGIELTQRQLQNAFEKHGIRRLECAGEKFDPNLHEAMMEMVSEDAPAGTVLQVYETAYMIEDRVLRPAKVIVAKAPPPPPVVDQPPTDASPAGAANDDGADQAPGDASDDTKPH
jgi:molecular chaperone GrpE